MNLNKIILFKKIKNILSRWGFSKMGVFRNSKGEWYFFAQMLAIILHLIPFYPKIVNLSVPINTLFIGTGLVISIQGLIIVIKAFRDLGNNLTPLTYPMNESSLIKNNSYQTTRHPIYKGILIISLGICISSLSIIHLFLLISLAYIVKRKAIKEEDILKLKYPEYEKYIEEVPAIIENMKYLDWRS